MTRCATATGSSSDAGSYSTCRARSAVPNISWRICAVASRKVRLARRRSNSSSGIASPVS